MKLSDRTVLVTGGASGIGLALTEALLERGNRVIVCGRSATRLAAARERLPALVTIPCDLGRADERQRLAKVLADDHPSLDVVVNNAGVMNRIDLRGDVDEVMRVAEAELATNLVAPIHLTLLLLPQLQRQTEAAIVNVGSGFAYAPGSPVPIYSASKAALHSFTRSVRRQLAPTNVRVFEVMPPVVDTDMTRGYGGTKWKPAAVAKAVMRGLAADQQELRIGPTGPIYVLSRVAPQLTFGMISKAMESEPAQEPA
jgi:uncharacterized oxidoreductase